MVLKIKGNRIWLTAIAILFAVTLTTTVIHIFKNGSDKNYTLSNTAVSGAKEASSDTSDIFRVSIKGMRGVWVPFMSLDTNQHSESSFKNNFDSLAETAVKNKINTLIVHVRPFSDALYNSDIFPSSHILSGTQGEAVEYDALKYMIEKTHEKGMKFHAWVNPYRIKTSDTPSKLSDDGILSILSDDDIIEYDGGIYINPSSEKGRSIIIEGVREIVKNYDVDGVQFDDYFYPSSDNSLDISSYREYISGLDSEAVALSHSEWRKAQVNMLISSVYSAVKQIKPKVIFGVSPQGNISNCSDIGADVGLWCQNEGYADYICPQAYVNFEHSFLPFDTMISQWKELAGSNKTSLCVGLALYKANNGDYDGGSWKNKNDILKQEVEYCRKNGIDNFIIYDIDYLDDSNTYEEVQNVMSVF